MSNIKRNHSSLFRAEPKALGCTCIYCCLWLYYLYLFVSVIRCWRCALSLGNDWAEGWVWRTDQHCVCSPGSLSSITTGRVMRFRAGRGLWERERSALSLSFDWLQWTLDSVSLLLLTPHRASHSGSTPTQQHFILLSKYCTCRINCILCMYIIT